MYSDRDDLAAGLPHSEIHGSRIARISPRLIATCYDLHRLSVPRHPPNALLALDPKHCIDRSIQRLGTLSISVISASHGFNARPRRRVTPSARAHGKTSVAGNCIRSTMSNNTGRMRSLSPPELFMRQAEQRSRQSWWAREDLNFRPHAYQARALTS